MSYVDYPSDLENPDLLKLTFECILAKVGDGVEYNYDIEVDHTLKLSKELVEKSQNAPKNRLVEIIERQFNDVVIDSLVKTVREYNNSLSDDVRKRLLNYLEYILHRDGCRTLLKLTLVFNHVPDIVHQIQLANPHIPKPINQIGDFNVNMYTQVNTIYELAEGKPVIRFNEKLAEVGGSIQGKIVDALTEIYFPNTDSYYED